MNFFSFYFFSAIKGNNIEDALKLIENNNNLLDDFILYDASNIIYPIQLAVKHGQYKVLVALIKSGINLKCFIRTGNSDNLDLMNYAIFNYGKAYQDSETTMKEKHDRYKIIKDLSNFFDVTKYFTYINKLDLAVQIDLCDRIFLDRLINI